MNIDRVWIITFGGSSRKVFYTEYHAEEFARALQLNGTKYDMVAREVPPIEDKEEKGVGPRAIAAFLAWLRWTETDLLVYIRTGRFPRMDA